MYNRNEVLKDLRNNVVEIVFVKEDESIRTMKCTLKEEFLPATYKAEKEEEANFHKENTDTLAVWDIENNGWRSFKIERLKDIQLVPGY